jgi:ParB family chromosome partitioning protein
VKDLGKQFHINKPQPKTAKHPMDESFLKENDDKIPENHKILSLEKIYPDSNQPRKINPDDDSIKELAASIQEHGLMNPIHVHMDADKTYKIINGERRFWACKAAGITEIPVIILDASNNENPGDWPVKQLVDNLQRLDLRPLEEAEGYQRLQEEFGLTHEEIAKRVGKSRTTITGALSLNKLPKQIQQKCQRVDIFIPKRFLIRLASESSEKRQTQILNNYIKSIIGKTSSSEKKQTEKSTFFHQVYAYENQGTTPKYKVLIRSDAKDPSTEDLVELLEKVIEEIKIKGLSSVD